jgi:hypothetical protein
MEGLIKFLNITGNKTRDFLFYVFIGLIMILYFNSLNVLFFKINLTKFFVLFGIKEWFWVFVYSYFIGQFLMCLSNFRKPKSFIKKIICDDGKGNEYLKKEVEIFLNNKDAYRVFVERYNTLSYFRYQLGNTFLFISLISVGLLIASCFYDFQFCCCQMLYFRRYLFISLVIGALLGIVFNLTSDKNYKELRERIKIMFELTKMVKEEQK